MFFRVPEKLISDSVEVIPEELEEVSVADDTISYTSVSESTAVTVLDSALIPSHPKQNQSKEIVTPRYENMIRHDSVTWHENFPEHTSKDTHVNFESNCLIEPITRPPSRSALHLPLLPNPVSIQPKSLNQDKCEFSKTSNVIDIPQENDNHQTETLQEITDDGSQSDRTLIASDHLIESGSDTSTTTDSNSNSTYLKNMLADAMVEKINDNTIDKQLDVVQNESEAVKTCVDIALRESSPVSSDSRSDLVKIGSDHASGHTSGDELETTTSSDIEIISSPNGDSSSTHSRHSPSKIRAGRTKTGDTNVDVLLEKMTFKKIKGHNRELSEASSTSEDSEMDRLIRRMSEITEILELREAKLIEISRKNVELMEVNGELRHQLDVVLNKESESANLSQVTEEYAQRLSALERKFQQAIREKDSLRKQLEQCKHEGTLKLSKGEVDLMMNEKLETIKELRDEGEKLSKQQLHHSNIIKKLRAKEKEQEVTIKHLKESVEDFTTETDRLKRSLSAKEEVERSQIDAVHQLTAKNKKLEAEVNSLKGHLDDLTQKYETTKKSLDAAKKELADKHKANTELLACEQLVQTLENEKRITESQTEEVWEHLCNILRLTLVPFHTAQFCYISFHDIQR